MTTETITIEWPAFSFTPSDEELEWERRYWEDMERIAEYDAYVEARAEAEAEEHEYSDGCDCDECYVTYHEYQAMHREYESMTRGW